MRPQRPPHYWPAILTVAFGIVAVPSTVGADEPVAPSDDQPNAPAPTESSPPSTVEEPPPPPTTEAPSPPDTTDTTDATSDPEPAPPVTAPDRVAPTTDSTSPVPDPEQAASPIDGTPPTEPSPVATVSEGIEETDGTEARSRVDDDEDALDHDAHALLPDGIVRPISFPVLGPVRYANDWGNCRDSCARRHQGTDLIGVRMQPLLAAVDGTVTRVRYESRGTAGSVISITGADGWYYNYFHVNNDTPGTDDGAAGPEWQIAPPLTVGTSVRAGQVIGYMGDSGNAEGSVPHLHFEIRQPDRTPVNPYRSLVPAQRRETCAPGLVALTDPAAVSPAAIAVIPLGGGGRWLIDRDGRLFAEGSATRVDPAAGVACDVVAPVIEVVEPPVQAADPVHWTVEPGQSLWQISQKAYGVSDAASTVPLVNFIFDNNGDLLVDPSSLEVGMTLRIPPLAL